MAMLELHVLRSGDKGSCAAVRVAGEQEFLCVDCGISGATFAQACSEAGLVPFKVRAFLITHCHSNQVKGLKSTLAWLSKRGVAPAVYVEPGVLAASPALQELQGACDMREFRTKQPFQVGDVLVRPFRTFHNNEDKGSCYNFRFEVRTQDGDVPASSRAGADGAASGADDELVVGETDVATAAVPADAAALRQAEPDPADSIVLLSDVGVLSREAQGELPHARLLAIEANYDTELLEAAAQTNAQVRFAVDTRGNFSNAQAATVVQAYAWPGLQDVVAMYLSRQYNTPQRATVAFEAALEQAGCQARVACSSPDAALSVLPESAQSPVWAGPRSLVSPDAALSVLPGGEGGLASEVGSAAPVTDAAAEVGAVEADATEAPALLDGAGAAEAPALTDVPVPAGVREGGPVRGDFPGQDRTERPASPDAVGGAFASSVHIPVYEDIFTPDQATGAGFVDVGGLLAAWEQEGRLAQGAPVGPSAALAAFEAAGLLDPRDSMPTEQGQELGIWAECVEGASEPEALLRPVFLRAAAPLLWEAACPWLGQ